MNDKEKYSIDAVLVSDEISKYFPSKALIILYHLRRE
jgi:hypothetical protein